MTKAEIVGEVSRSTGIDKAIVSTVVESFMESVKESIGKKNNVYLRGFGTFQVKKRARKVARNISKNTTLIVPEHNIPAFKPAPKFFVVLKYGLFSEHRRGTVCPVPRRFSSRPDRMQPALRGRRSSTRHNVSRPFPDRCR